MTSRDRITSFENVNGGLGNDRITGDGFINRLVGNFGDDALSGMDGNDLLFGGVGLDRIADGAGNDEIHGGEGRDTLFGGADSDIFFFDAKLGKNNVDKVRDFSPIADTVALDHDIFAKLDLGVLRGRFFHVGAEADDANDHIIYKDTTGALFYDRDGVDGAVQVQFAKLKAHLNLEAADFLVA